MDNHSKSGLFLLHFAQSSGVEGRVNAGRRAFVSGSRPTQVDVVGDGDMVALPLERLQLLPLPSSLQHHPQLLLTLTFPR
jgi:hypothetical protein